MTIKTTTTHRVPTRFYGDIRFDVQPQYAALTIKQVETKFVRLKNRLLQPVLSRTDNPELKRQLQLAANEASAVAWTTPFPLLVLPVLLEEKSAEVHRYAAHQKEVEHASLALAEAGP
jgi:hypothetical protein